jgi:hypothetical protein
MRRLLPPLNLTALLALAALGDLVLYRVVSGVFLPSHQGSPTERWVAGLALFFSNFSALLGLLLGGVALFNAVRSDHVFPRSMRITVSTVGLFFLTLAALDVLLVLAPRYRMYMRISHGFLVCFLAAGIWHGLRRTRAKLAITLLAIPILLQPAALFVHRMGVAHIDAGQVLRAGQLLALTAMILTPLLLMPAPLGKIQLALATAVGVLIAGALSAAFTLRFDLVQAVAYYGLRFELTGLASATERAYTSALVLAIAGMGATATACVLKRGPATLIGWGLLLLAATGMDVDSAKPALFSLCGLLAIAAASAEESPAPAPAELVAEA